MPDLPAPRHQLYEPSLASTYLDDIEALWIRRRAMMFDSRRTLAEVGKIAERFARAHAALLGCPRSEVVGACAKRMTSPVAAEQFAGTWVASALCGAEAWNLALRAQSSFPWVDALRHAPIGPAKLSLTDGPSIDAGSFHGEVPMGVLLAGLHSFDVETRRAAILAVGRHPRPPEFALRVVRRLSVEGEAELRAVAVYAVGLATPSEWERFVLDERGTDVLDEPHGPFFAGLFGGPAMRHHLERRIDQAPRASFLRALGVLGYPASFPRLQALVRHTAADVRLAAAVALFEAGGTRFDYPTGLSEDVRAVLSLGERDPMPSAGAAEVRHHRGYPLLSAAAPELATHAWLRSVVARASTKSRLELPDPVLGEGYHAPGYGPFNLGAGA
jgi:hypothetical protein